MCKNIVDKLSSYADKIYYDVKLQKLEMLGKIFCVKYEIRRYAIQHPVVLSDRWQDNSPREYPQGPTENENKEHNIKGKGLK